MLAVEIFSEFSYSFSEVELNWHSEVLRLFKILTPKNQSFPKLNTISYKISVGVSLGGWGEEIVLFFKE